MTDKTSRDSCAESKKTCISISTETRNKLAVIGDKDSTFDEIVQKLLSKWEMGK